MSFAETFCKFAESAGHQLVACSASLRNSHQRVFHSVCSDPPAGSNYRVLSQFWYSAGRGKGISLFSSQVETKIDRPLTRCLSVIGLGEGNLRPTLTGNGAIDVIDVSAANMTLANFIFAAPLTDAQTADVNVDAAYFKLIDTKHLGSVATENKVSFVTITASGDNLLVDGMRGFNDVVDMISGIEIAAADSVEIKNSVITSSGTVGYETGRATGRATG